MFGADGADPAGIPLWAAILGAAVSLGSASIAGLFAFRGSKATVDNDRDKRYDERVDRENQRLRETNDRLVTEVMSAREKTARLRVLLIEHGIDPDSGEPIGEHQTPPSASGPAAG